MAPPRLCHVCATGAAKYKCPACRSPYCSAACYKTHKEAPCGPQAATAPPPATAATATTDTASYSSSSSTSNTQLSPPPPPPPSQKTQQQELEDAGVDPAQLLTAEQLSGLSASPALRTALADPALRALLTKIESSGNRTKELQKALLDKSFADFMYQTLDAVAATES